jgi:hypothetical protein
MNQRRKDPSHLYTLSPHSPQFQQSAVICSVQTRAAKADRKSLVPARQAQ